jgi:hypothetical protein
VLNANIPDKIRTISNDPGKLKTIFNVVVIDGDKVIDDETSAIEICKAVEEIHHICNIFHVPTPNGGHGGYYTPEGQVKYKELFQEIQRVNAPQLQQTWGEYYEYRENMQKLNAMRIQ